MTLMKRTNPFSPVSNFFDDIFDDVEIFNKMQTVPSVNIIERKDDFMIELAAPGFKKDDFEIDLDNNVLTISSQKEEKDQEVEENKYTKREFSFCSFKRAFTLPDTADVEKIDANYKDGILNVIVGKKPEAKVKPKRKISIK